MANHLPDYTHYPHHQIGAITREPRPCPPDELDGQGADVWGVRARRHGTSVGRARESEN